MVGQESRFLQSGLGRHSRSPFFRGLKFEVPKTLTWYFTDDLSNLPSHGVGEVVDVLDELASLFPQNICCNEFPMLISDFRVITLGHMAKSGMNKEVSKACISTV